MSRAAVDDDEEPTRFFAHEVAAEEIVPVAPPAPGFDPKEPLETSVPTDPGEVEFKRAGEETGASKKKKKALQPTMPPSPRKPRKTKHRPQVAKPEQAAPPKKAGRRGARQRQGGFEALVQEYRARDCSPVERLALLVAVAAGALMLGGGDSGDERLQFPIWRAGTRLDRRSRTSAASLPPSARSPRKREKPALRQPR